MHCRGVVRVRRIPHSLAVDVVWRVVGLRGVGGMAVLPAVVPLCRDGERVGLVVSSRSCHNRCITVAGIVLIVVLSVIPFVIIIWVVMPRNRNRRGGRNRRNHR